MTLIIGILVEKTHVLGVNSAVDGKKRQVVPYHR